MKKIKDKLIREGVMLFCVGLALIAVWFAIHNTDSLRGGIAELNDILMPFYIGFVLAYLICPVYNGVVRNFYSLLDECMEKKQRAYKLARLGASVVALVTLIGAVGGFCLLVIPDLITSITTLVQNMPETINRISDWFVVHVEENPQLLALFQDNLQMITERANDWFQSILQPAIDTVISGAAVGIIGTVNIVFDVFVALIVCVYVLNSKEMFQAQVKKMILALFKKERAESIFELGNITNKTFGGFINGKIIDSIIIGILCFVVMSLLKMPMPTLISVIVGITNVIPFFGPFIGAIPSIFLILIVDPIEAVKFAVWVLVLQQLDGNIIGPKILGDSTGLASFWVLFSIIVSGGLFGFVGMIVGVPIFAVFYTYVTRFINSRLNEKGLETDTAVYEEFTKYEIDKEDIFGKERCNPGSCEPVEGE